jgi:hypothetical protein
MVFIDLLRMLSRLALDFDGGGGIVTVVTPT